MLAHLVALAGVAACASASPDAYPLLASVDSDSGASIVENLLTPPQPRLLGEAQKVSVAVYILNIVSVALSKGSFDVDFLLYLKSPAQYAGNCGPSASSCSPQDGLSRVLVNMATAGTIQSIDKFYGNRNFTTQFRVKGSFTYSSDISRWPFETQLLEIRIQDPTRDASSLTFTVLSELTRMSPTASAPGWLHGERLLPATRIVAYAGGRNFSEYVARIPLRRPLGNTIVKTMLAPFLLSILQVFSFAITPSNVESRISIVGSSLTSAVVYHVTLASATPPMSYLLFGDKVMVCLYVLIVVNGIASVRMLKERRVKDDEERAMNVYHLAERVMMMLVPSLCLALVMEWYDVPTVLSSCVVVAGISFGCVLHCFLCPRCCQRKTQASHYVELELQQPASPEWKD